MAARGRPANRAVAAVSAEASAASGASPPARRRVVVAVGTVACAMR